MENNKAILKEWDDSISIYPKINFEDAQRLYKEITTCNDTKLKSKLNDNLITGTLYVVLDFIKKNGLIYLNSSSYDMADIISTCNEIWINKINAGVLLKVNSFREVFDSDFYNMLAKGLNVDKNAIASNIKLFMDLLFKYLKFKKENINCNHYNFIEYLKTNKEYPSNFFDTYDDNCLINFCLLFDAIVESLELGDLDLNISKTKFEKLKYIIIYNGLEYLRKDLNQVICSDTTEIWLNDYCKQEIIKIIFDSDRLSDAQKDIISKRYGIHDGKQMTLDEVANVYNVTRERIRQREDKILRLIRHPIFSKKIRELL